LRAQQFGAAVERDRQGGQHHHHGGRIRPDEHSPISGATVYGRTVAFYATVQRQDNGAPVLNGSVQFFVDGKPQGQPVALNSGGMAGLVTNGLTAGTHNIEVAYLGATNFLTSGTPAPFVATVTKFQPQVIVFPYPSSSLPA